MGQVDGKPITVLIDGGSTHNFMQTRVAKFLGLPILPYEHLQVTVGNGASMQCAGCCKEVSVRLDTYCCTLDFYLLPIYGADLVLGVQWLATLGPTLFDYKELWMQFDDHGNHIRLKGLQEPSFSSLIFSQFKRLEQTNAVATYYHMSVTPLATTQEPIHPSVGHDFRDNLERLLHEYSDVFALPKGLPPQRQFDHHIPLLPDSAPVNVRPFRYPHF